MTTPISQNISKIKSNRIMLLGFLFTAIYLFNINITSANTGINLQIPYSRTIVKNDGTVLDGNRNAKFIIYNSQALSESANIIHQEIRTIEIRDGRFEVLLGETTPIDISKLNDDSLWLELQLNIDTTNPDYEEIFAPRKRIGSALSAINFMRLVAANGGVSTNTLSLDSIGNLVFTGDSAIERMKITSTGVITASALGGTANAAITPGFDRVLLANSSGQFSQVNISSLLGSSGWVVTGNNTSNAWNGTSGTRLGTTSAQPLVLATTNATAQDIRFFTGDNGANERMRITGDGNIGIGTTTPQARLDVNGGIRVGNEATNCTSSNVGTLRYNNGGLQVCRAEGWLYLQCPTGYIPVPGSSLYGTRDFCVMKYEAKTGSSTVAATTQAAGIPLGNLNQTGADAACSLAGGSLINNREWMTIARNIEAQASNWRNGVIGSTDASGGGLYRGHSDNVPGGFIAASTDDSLGYEGTGNTSPSRERRTHTLSNGEVIWDLSGNILERTNDTILGYFKPTPGGTYWQEWTGVSNFGTLSYDLTRPSNNAWNSTQNMGKYYAGSVTLGNPYGFVRGGDFNDAAGAGVFSLSPQWHPASNFSNIGFRCVISNYKTVL